MRILYELQEKDLFISSDSTFTEYGRILLCAHSFKVTLSSYQKQYNLVRIV